MFKFKPKSARGRQRTESKQRRSIWSALFAFRSLCLLVALTGVFLYTRAGAPTHVSAATNNELNFQARLLNGNGGIVADGTYNVEFKLYTSAAAGGSAQGSCVGGVTDDCVWMETRTGGNKVTVHNGYLSVHLGDVTPFGSINWDQQLYLTMNIGGTGSPTWDGEMSPRLELTSVPYAFQAARSETLAKTVTGNLGQLLFPASLGQSTTYNLIDPGQASVNICLSTGNCGGAGVTFQTTYNNSTPASFTLNSTNGGLVVKDNATPLGTELLAVKNNAGTISYLSVDASGISVTGDITLSGTLNVTSGSAVLGDATTAGVLTLNDGNGATGTLSVNTLTQSTAFALPDVNNANAEICVKYGITNSGNCAGAGGGLTGTGTATKIAVYTGSGSSVTLGSSWLTQNSGNSALELDSTRDLSLLGGDLHVTGSGDFSGTLSVAGAATLGDATTAGSLIINDGAGLAGTITIDPLTQATTFSLPDVNNAAAEICVRYGSGSSNCAGAGGGITGAGTAGRVPVYTGSGSTTTIGNSYLLQSGTALTLDDDIDLVVDATDSTFTVDATNNRVGVGTASPAELFSVGTTSQLQIDASGNLTTSGTINSNTFNGTTLTFGGSNPTISPSTTNSGIAINPNGTGTLSLGNSGLANTIQIGNTTGAVNQTINVGNNNTASSQTNITIGSTIGASTTTIQAGSGGLVLNTSTISRTASGTTTIDLVDGANTILALTNSGAGVAGFTVDGSITAATGLTVSSGGISVSGNSTIAGTLSSLTGVSSSGNIDFSSLNAGGLVKAAATTGRLSVATAGTDYEVPLTFTNGLTRSTNTISLGGNLTSDTTIGQNGHSLTFTGSNGNITVASTGTATFGATGTGLIVTNDASVGNTLTIGTASQQGTVSLNDGNGLAVNLKSAVLGTSSFNVTFPDVDGTDQVVCYQNDPNCGFLTGSSAGFVQLAPVSAQADNSNNSSLFINKGASNTGNLIQLQSNATDRFVVDYQGNASVSGNFTAGGSITAATGLTVSAGGITVTGNSTIAGTLSSLTGLSSSGNIDFASLNAGGLVKASATTGRLTLATAGTDYEVPLTFTNGLTRTSNAVALGGTLTADTDIPLGGFNLTLSGSGKVGIGTSGTPSQTLSVGGTTGNFTVDNTGAVVAVGVNAGSGLLQGTGGLTLTGTTAINTTGTAATSIGNSTANTTITAAAILLNSATLSRTAAGTTTLDLVDTGNTVLTLTNSGTGVANFTVDGSITAATGLTVSGGGITVSGNSTINGTLSSLTGLSSSGNIDFASLNAGGLVKADVTTGRLSVATAGTDYEVPLTFTNGLTRTSNTVSLGGTLGANTDIALNGNNFTFSGTGNVGIGASATNKLNVNVATTADSAAQVLVSTGSAANKGLVVQGVASQTGTLLGLQNSSGTVLTNFAANGSLNVGSATNGNLVANPSFETNTTGWAGANGATIASDSTRAWVGTKSAKVTSTGTNAALAYTINAGMLANSTTYTFSSYMYNPTSGGFSGTVYASVQGAIVNSTTSSSTTALKDGWVRLTVTFTTSATANSSTGNIFIANSTAGTVNSGEIIFVDGAQLELGGSVTPYISSTHATGDITGTGNLAIQGNGTFNGGINVVAAGSSSVAAVIRGVSGQSADVFQAQDVNGSALFKIGPGGSTTIGSTQATGNAGGLARLTVNQGTTTNIGIIVKGVANQTGDQFELQDNSGNIQSGFDSTGQLYLGRASALTGTAKFYNASGSGSITLQASNPSTTDYTINLPAENGTLCIQSSANCGFALAATNGYIRLAPSSADTDSTTSSSIFINKTGASGNILQLQKSGTDLFTVANDGSTVISQNLGLGGAATAAKFQVTTSGIAARLNVLGTNDILQLQNNGTSVFTVSSTGAVLSKNSTDSTTALQVLNSSNASVLDVNTTNNTVTIGNVTPTTTSKLLVNASSIVATTINQTGSNDILDLQSSGTTISNVNSSGFFGINTSATANNKLAINTATTASTTAQVLVATGADGNKGLVIQANSVNQSANLAEFQDSTGAVKAFVSATGSFYSTGALGAGVTGALQSGGQNAYLSVQPASGSNPGIIVKGAASGQTANLIEYQDSSGAVVANVTAAGSFQTSQGFQLNTGSNTGGYIVKVAYVESGTINQYDVVVYTNTTSGNMQTTTTTTARDPRVFGVSITSGARTSSQNFSAAIGGNTQVNVDSGAVAIGDQLVTSTTAGKATVDNTATTGIIGIATSAKAAGSAGTVGIYIRPVGGQANPTFQGNVTVSGLLTGNGGATVLGATSINTSGSATTNIGTGGTGTITIGAASGTDLVLQDAQWGVTGAGAATFTSVNAGSGTIQTTGTISAGALNASGTVNFSGLTASRLVATDGSKNLVSTITAANLAASVTGTTGTGNLVFSASPTFTGTLSAADVTLSGNLTVNGGSGTFGASGTAGSLILYDGASGGSANTLTLNVSGSLAQNSTITFPDPGATTANVCYQNDPNCGFALTSGSGFVQFTPSSAQSDASAFASIYINDTGGGNLIQLQSGGNDMFVVDNSGNVTVAGDLAVNGGNITTTNTTATIFNSTVTNLSIGGAATTVSIGATTGNTNINNNLDVAGTLTAGTANAFTINASGAITAATGITSSGTINFSGLTANRLVATDGSKNLTNTISSANLAASISDETGSGAAVFATSPTVTTLTVSSGGAAITGNSSITGNLDVSGTLFAGTSDAFQVAANGAVTAVGVNAGTGLLQGTGGLTLTGATNINTTGAAATNIGTGGTGTITIGAASGTDLVLQDAQWGVTGAGAATFASVDAGSGTIQTTGSVLANDLDRTTAGTLTVGNTTATAVSICNSTACDTITIGTNTDADTITVGDANDTFSLASTGLNVSTAGVLSGITGYSQTSGVFAFSGGGNFSIDSAAFDVTTAGAVSGVTTLSTSGIITVGSLGTANTDAVVCRNSSNQLATCNSTFATTPASGSYLKQVPTSTADNTVTPTAASVVGLTVNGTSGTAATAVNILQGGAATGLAVTSSNTGDGQSINLTNTSGTQTNGLLINRNGAGGTTTNLLNLTNTAGTATNALNISGTFTNLINAPNLVVTNAGNADFAGSLTAGTSDAFQVNTSGAIAAATGITSSGNITFSGLTANRLVATTTGGQLTNTITAANLLSSVTGTTGTGNLVFSANPTFTGTVSVADLTASGTITLNSDGVTDFTGSGIVLSSGALTVDATSSTGFFRNGGNNFGGNATLGTNGAGQTLGFKTAGTTRAILDASGNLAFQQASSISTTSGNDISLQSSGTGATNISSGSGNINLQNNTVVASGQNLTVDTNTLFVDGANDKVSIGTTSGNARFEVTGGTAVSGPGTISSSSTTVTGTVSFAGVIRPGDTITASGQTRTVTSVSGTTLTTQTAFNPVIASGTSYTYTQPTQRITNSSDQTGLLIQNSASQLAPALQVQDSTGTEVLRVNTNGSTKLTISSTTTSSSGSQPAAFIQQIGTPSSAPGGGGLSIGALTTQALAAGSNVNANTTVVGYAGSAGNSSSNTLGTAIGSLGQIFSANNITNAYGAEGIISNAGTGTFTTGAALVAATPTFTTTGTITTAYGLYIQQQAVASRVGTSYGVYQASSSDLNYFAGNTSIGTTVATNAFQVGSGGTANFSVSSGGDVTLNGNLTVGDASSDTVTINSTSVSIPNNLNFDSNTLFIDSTNDRVGIGTNAPSTALQVSKSSTANTTILVTNTNSGTGAYSELTAANDNTTGFAKLLTTGTGFTTSGAFKQDGAVLQAGAGLSGGLSIASNAGDIRFYTGGAGDANQRVTILSTGEFGIGDTTPAAMFTVGNGDLFQVNSSGAIAAAAGITSSGTINFSGLTANSIVATDGSKNLVSTITAANLLNSVTGTTGTGNLVFSASPTFTGTVSAAAVSLTGNLSQSGATTITSGTGGYLINGGTNTAGHYLRNNGTSYVDGTIQSSDLPSLSGTYLRNVPATTAENTVTPTAASVVGLTVNGTSGTAADAVDILQGGAATGLAITSSSTGSGQTISLTNTTGTQAAGLSIDRNGTGGTTTSLINLSNTAGTVTNAINLTGTVGTGIKINNAPTTNILDTPSLDISGTGAISGATGITSSGTITFSGLTAGRFVGTTTGGQLTTTLASSSLANSLSDETGTGVSVFGTSPTFSTSLLTSDSSFDVFNTNATTINAFGAATTLTLGATTGTTTIRNDLAVTTGNITSGTNTDLTLVANGSGVINLNDTVNVSSLTASRLVATDGSKNLVSTITAANLLSSVTGTTGTGNLVFSASPTFTGTVNAAAITATGNLTVDTNTLFVDATNHRVGIGTTSTVAGYVLTVGGDIRVNDATPMIFLDGGNSPTVRTAWDNLTFDADFDNDGSGNLFTFNGNGSAVLTVNNSGNFNFTNAGTFGTGLTVTSGGATITAGGLTVSAGGAAITGNSTIAGTLTGLTGLTSSGTVTFSGLTAGRFVGTTTGGQLTTTLASSALTASLSDETGTGVAVFGTSPTFATSVLTSDSSFDVFNTNATTINAFGAATTLTLGATTGSTTIRNDVTATTGNITSGTNTDLTLTANGTGVINLNDTVNVSSLTASRLVATDGSKNLVNTITAANLLSSVTGTTGTGNLVFSASPTFTGTVTAAAVTTSGNVTVGSTSASALVVTNSGTTETVLTADTSARSASGGNLIKVGNSTGTDTATTVLQLDSANADITTNVSALNGGLYYYDGNGTGTNARIKGIINSTVYDVCTTQGNCTGGSGGIGGSGTQNQVAYFNGSSTITSSSNFTWNGTTLGVTAATNINTTGSATTTIGNSGAAISIQGNGAAASTVLQGYRVAGDSNDRFQITADGTLNFGPGNTATDTTIFRQGTGHVRVSNYLEVGTGITGNARLTVAAAPFIGGASASTAGINVVAATTNIITTAQTGDVSVVQIGQSTFTSTPAGSVIPNLSGLRVVGPTVSGGNVTATNTQAALFETGADANKGIVIKGNSASQSATLFETQSSTGTILTTITAGGTVQAQNLAILNSSVSNGWLTKTYTAGTGGVSANDVVICANDGGQYRVITTTTARDTRVCGVANATSASGSTIAVHFGGNYQVTADTGAVAIGDQLVTSTTAGQVMVDNNATSGIVGYATTTKSAGSSGLVGITIRITTGQTNPTFQGNVTVQGLLTGNGGASVLGATNINTSGSAATNIGTGGSGVITIGATSGTDLALQDAQWSITGVGAATFASVDAGSGTIQTTGSVLGNNFDRTTAGTLAVGNSTATAVSICNSSACDTIDIGTNNDADTITVGDANDTIGINGTVTVTGGTTILGTTSINGSGTANTTIGNSAGGTITIGAATGSDLALQDAQWSITGAGAATFVSAYVTTDLTVDGNATLGNANTDTLTVNGTAVSIPNNLNFDSDTLFIDAANNRVGIGTNTPAYKLSVVDTSTANSGVSIGSSFVLGVNPSSAPAAPTTYNATSAGIATAGSNINSNTTITASTNAAYHFTADTLGVAFGTVSVVSNLSTGTITNAFGLQGQITNTSTGSITTAVNVLSSSPVISAGSIGTQYGVYIQPQKISGVTGNGYGIWQEGTSDLNNFAGKVGIGLSNPASPSQLLSVGGTTGAFTVDVSGNVATTGTYNTNTFTGTQLLFGGASGTVGVNTTNGALTVNSNGTGALTLDSGTTGNVNLGTGANAKSVTVGNTTGATAVVINTGTGGVNIGDNANTKQIDIGGNDADGTDTIRIATNSTTADTITIGNTSANTAITLNAGSTGGITVSGIQAASSAVALCLSSNKLSYCDANNTAASILQNGNTFGATVSIGSNDAQSVALRTGGANRFIIDSTGATATYQQATTLSANGNFTIQASGTNTLALNTAGAGTVNVATANTTALSLGNTSASFTAESNATANLFNGATAHTVQIATGAAAQTVTIGSTDTTSSLTLQAGSNGIALNGNSTVTTGNNLTVTNGLTTLARTTDAKILQINANSTQTNDIISVLGSNGTTNNLTLSGNGNLTLRPTTDGNNVFAIQGGTTGANVFKIDTTPDASNLVTASGFEGSISTGWTYKQGAGGTGSIATTSATQMIGTRALAINTTVAGDGAKYTFSGGALANGTYNFTLYARSPNATGNFSTIEMGYSADGSTDTNCATNQSVYTGGYTRLTCSFTASGATASNYVYIRQSDATARTFHIDAVQVSTTAATNAYFEAGLFSAARFTQPATFTPSTNTTSGLQVTTQGGSTVFNVDTLNSRVGIGSNITNPTATLQVTALSPGNLQTADPVLVVTGGEGAAAGAGQTAGNGSLINLTSGKGGNTSASSGIAGVGGAITIQGGAGGNAQGTANSGNGGSITIQGGAPGTVNSGTLGSYGAVSIQTTAGSVSIGSTSGTAALTLRVGTGNFSLDGVAGSTYAIGASTTTGTIAIGGTGTTGAISLGQYTGSSTSTINIGNGATTGTQQIFIGTGATGAGKDNVTIGSGNDGSTTTINAGTGGVTIATGTNGSGASGALGLSTGQGTTASGNITIATGTATGGTSGNASLKSGSGTTGTGTVTIQSGDASAGTAGTVTIDNGTSSTGTATINLGTAAQAHSVNIATASGTAQTIQVGGNYTSGGSNASSTVTLQAGAAAVNVSNSGVIARTFTDSATAFQVQNAFGATALTIDNTNSSSGLNVAVNGGGETGGTPPTGWANHSATVTQTTTAGNFASGSAGVQAAITGANQGASNNVGSALVSGTTYSVSFSIKSSSGTPTLSVLYNNGTTSTACTTVGSYDSANIASRFVKYTCSFTANANNAGSYVAITQTDSTSRSLYIDNLSIVSTNSSGTQNTGVLKVGGGSSQGLTLLQLDTYAGTPFTGSNYSLAGAMYFDTVQNKMQCYDGTQWGACGAAPNSLITLTPEYAGAVLHGVNDAYGSGTDKNIGTLSSDFCSNETGVLVVPATGNICNNHDARNYYNWTTVQTNYQSYGLYVTYKLPSTFKAFVGNVSVTGRVDNTTNAGVNYTIYRSTGSAITQCGGGTGNVVGWTGAAASGSAGTWSSATLNPATNCTFTANDYLIIKIDAVAKSSANAYLENVNFTFSNQ